MTAKIEITMLGRGKISLSFEDVEDKQGDCWDIHMKTRDVAKVYVGRVSKGDLKRVTKAS